MALETCTNCERAIGNLEQAYIFDEHIVCDVCYEKLSSIKEPSIIESKKLEPKDQKKELPLCPYCKAELKNRKTPKRCSSFACPSCHEKIIVDPHQFIYPSVYLTDVEAGCVGYLWQLDHWVFAKGSRKDYQRMKTELRNKFKAEPKIRDIIWGLMNKSLIKCAQYEQDDIRGLMKEFRQFENDIKSSQAQKSKKNSTIEKSLLDKSVQTIEKTGKKWKRFQLAGVLMSIVGVVLLPMAEVLPTIARIGGVLLFFGLGLYIFARVGAWWYHG